jgi:hypothetical protein
MIYYLFQYNSTTYFFSLAKIPMQDPDPKLTTAALRVRIQTSLKNKKWATNAKEWPTHSSLPKDIQKKLTALLDPDP